MTDSILKHKVSVTLDECATHVRRMAYAHKKISHFLPTTADAVLYLDDAQVESLDQYIYRFTKWQDAMGSRLFFLTLEVLAEEPRAMAFIDRLHRLEQVGALRSAVEWLDLRQLRNTLAHEYDDSSEELADSINTVYDKYEDILEIFEQVRAYVGAYLSNSPSPVISRTSGSTSSYGPE